MSVALSPRLSEYPKLNLNLVSRALPAARFFTAIHPVAIILGYYLITALVVSPVGNFPLNDDWIYGQAVETLVKTGKWDLGCSVAACFLQILAGAFVCKIFGFSYSALRVLDLLIASVGTLALYATLRELALKRWVAGLFALVYAANPLIVSLSYSFMTDIWSLSLNNLYFLFLLRGIRRQSRGALIAAGLMLVASIAVRQTAIIFVACNFILLPMYWARRRHSWPVSILLIALPVLFALASQHWASLAGKYTMGPQWYQDSTAVILKEWLRAPVRSLFAASVLAGQISCYFGLFCAPILCAFFPILLDLVKHRVRLAPVWFLIAGNTVGTAITKLMLVDKMLMPFNQNTLHIPALGPSTVIGANAQILTDKARFVVTNLSALMGFVLLSVLGGGFQTAIVLAGRTFLQGRRSVTRSLDRPWRRAGVIAFCWSALVVSTGFLLLQTSVCDLDRYYLLAFAPVLICLALCWRWCRARVTPVVPVALVVLIAIYSALSQHDYMSWNTARWSLLTAYERSGVKASEIDGGAEFNFDRNAILNRSLVTSSRGLHYKNLGAPPRDRLRWWPIVGERYIVSFTPIPDYEVVDRVSYWSALSFDNRDILMLRRREPCSTVSEVQRKARAGSSAPGA